MEHNNRSLVEIPENKSHRERILKWLKVLFICEIVRLVMPVISFIPVLDSVVTLLTRAVSIVVLIAMFQLAPVNGRYRKAGIFYCISVVGGIVLAFLQAGIFSIVFSICSLIAKYQELNAHSELTEPMDEKLSERWHTLFGLELAGGIIAAFIAAIPVIIAVVVEADAEAITLITTAVISLVSIVIELLYVIYMKQTLALFEKD